MTTKDIIEKFDEKYLRPLAGNEELNTQDIIDLLLSIKKDIQSSLTELLDSVLEKLPKENNYTDGGNSYGVGYNKYRQEVINIINSHR